MSGFSMPLLAAKVFGLQPEQWSAIEAIGTVVGAFATFSAVVVALYLSRRAEKPRIRIGTAIMETVPDGTLGYKRMSLFTISATNEGLNKVTLKLVYFTFGRFRGKRVMIYLVGPQAIQGSLPATLENGEDLQIAIPLENFTTKGFENMVATLKDSRHPEWMAKTWRCGFATSIGESKTVPMDARLRKMLWEAYLKDKTATSSTKPDAHKGKS